MMLLLSFNSLSQCEDSVCKIILSKIIKIREQEETISNLEEIIDVKNIEIADLKSQLKKAQEQPLKDEMLQNDMIDDLLSEINYQDQHLKSKEQELLDSQIRQNELLGQLKRLESDNEILINENNYLKSQINQLYEELGVKEGIIVDAKEDNRKISFIQSYISDFSLGYKSRGNIIFSEIYKDGVSKPYRKGRKSNLDYLKIEKGQYIEIMTDSPFSEKIEGYVLVYSNGKLTTQLESIMKRDYEDFLSGYRIYNLEVQNELPHAVSEEAIIKIGFIDIQTYNSINKGEIESYAFARDEGHFLISSSKPMPIDYYTHVKGIVISAENKATTKYGTVILEIEDYNHPDDDIVNVYLNDELLIGELTLPQKGKPYIIENINLKQGHNIIKFEVVSTGENPPCTMQYRIRQNGNSPTILTNKISGKQNDKRINSILINYKIKN